MRTCGHLFHEWRNLLENDPDCWTILRVQANSVVWRNRAFREMTTGPEFSTWDEVKALIGTEEATRQEDAHERTLEMGTVEDAAFTSRGQAYHYWLRAHICERCTLRCAVIPALVRPVNSPASDPPVPANRQQPA